ncbi:hypothetical protein SS33_03720 [Enterobacter kobei]|nr:hypothetical protein SS33_03720 [Enterobacter kobei]
MTGCQKQIWTVWWEKSRSIIYKRVALKSEPLNDGHAFMPPDIFHNFSIQIRISASNALTNGWWKVTENSITGDANAPVSRKNDSHISLLQ